MLFKPEHIRLIKEGFKTATRRDWKRKMAKVGGVYACQTEMFQPKEDCEVFIKVTDLYRQKLKEMTLRDLAKEGGYTGLEEFKEVWKEINGGWIG